MPPLDSESQITPPPQKYIRERIGLVVVHGIGDQNKNEHLQNVAKHLVKAASKVFGKQNVNVEMFPGIENGSDLTILIRPNGDSDPALVAIDVHEMWWKDLGEQATPWTIVKFWLWARHICRNCWPLSHRHGSFGLPRTYMVKDSRTPRVSAIAVLSMGSSSPLHKDYLLFCSPVSASYLGTDHQHSARHPTDQPFSDGLLIHELSPALSATQRSQGRHSSRL